MTDPTSVSAAAVTPDADDGRDGPTLADLLHRARVEVLPLSGAAEQVEQHLPTSLVVTVTASPLRGLGPTLDLTEALTERGFSVVPHLAARLVADEPHLREVLARLGESGVSDVFVVAGDGDVPAGEFRDAQQLLDAMSRVRQSGQVPSPGRVGLTGYPEGHPDISDDELTRSLLAKQASGTYVVTQMCFDGEAVRRWIRDSRRLGLRLPVYAGIPGVVDRLKLIKVAGRVGVGQSLRFLNKHRGGARLLRPGGYRPDGLLDELLPADVPADERIEGLHIYTLGDVAATERWRRELLQRLTDGGATDE